MPFHNYHSRGKLKIVKKNIMIICKNNWQLVINWHIYRIIVVLYVVLELLKKIVLPSHKNSQF